MNQSEMRLHSGCTVHFAPAYLSDPLSDFLRVWFQDYYAPVCTLEGFQWTQSPPPEQHQTLRRVREQRCAQTSSCPRIQSYNLVSYVLTLSDLQSLQLVFCGLSMLLITSQDGGEAGHHRGLQRGMLRAHYWHSIPPICKGYISVAQNLWYRLHEG